MSKLRRLALTGMTAAAFCGFNVVVASATPANHEDPGCVDLVDHGGGNLADPGNGGEHHNEANGVGNAGDPGNGQGHFCLTE
jgi:hypothetical protein